MLRPILLVLAALSLPVFAAGCAVEPETSEEMGETSNAITGNLDEGAQFVTTSRLNFRTGPGTEYPKVTPVSLRIGAVVTILDGTPQNSFYNVSVEGQDETGWVHGNFIKESTPVAKDDGDDEVPKAGTGNIETCKASFYTTGQKTANGERFNTNDLTAAHKTLKFNTMVRVTNTKTGATVDVRINDRGPFIKGRCIDLSRASFAAIADLDQGVASVTVETLN